MPFVGEPVNVDENLSLKTIVNVESDLTYKKGIGQLCQNDATRQ
jgi:hypothetical protein